MEQAVQKGCQQASLRKFISAPSPSPNFLLLLPLPAFCLTERVIKCKIGFLLFVCAKYILPFFFVLSLVAVLVCRFGKFSNCVADRADSSLRSECAYFAQFFKGFPSLWPRAKTFIMRFRYPLLSHLPS